jgi:phosphomannomutase
MRTLREKLAYIPHELKFGTSGRRGEVVHLTQLEVYLNALAELQYLQSMPQSEGGIVRGEPFFFAHDLRPSSSGYVPEQGGRGEIAQAIERAVCDAGMQPVNLGRIPTPALACYALHQGKGSIMVTGSHIPFDRNGYKTNSSSGELRKEDELPIQCFAARIREKLYNESFDSSPFDEQGSFKSGHCDLSPETTVGRAHYAKRYLEFFAGRTLRGLKLLVYQHSAVGRDLLVEILRNLGADVIPAGRSDTFVPIDTENMGERQLAAIRALAESACFHHDPIDGVISTDGDSDRPLLIGVEPSSPCRVRFFGGDLVGMITAEYLGSDAVVVPVSCNDAVDQGSLKGVLEPKTRIGSPWVIAGMEKARAKGKRAICGWEANGGFLTGSDITSDGRVLTALPTRDALLPILSVLDSMCERDLSMGELFALLPPRFSRAALLGNFPRSRSLNILERFSAGNCEVMEVVFANDKAFTRNEDGREIQSQGAEPESLLEIRRQLTEVFSPALGFGTIVSINYVDGMRIRFDNGDVAHVRPSGNADELRIYAVAGSQERADAIARMAIEEPDGILRRLEDHGKTEGTRLGVVTPIGLIRPGDE